MAIVEGRIEPHVFGPGEAVSALEAVTLAEAEAMSQASGALFEYLRGLEPGAFAEMLRRMPQTPKLAELLKTVRDAMR